MTGFIQDRNELRYNEEMYKNTWVRLYTPSSAFIGYVSEIDEFHFWLVPALVQENIADNNGEKKGVRLYLEKETPSRIRRIFVQGIEPVREGYVNELVEKVNGSTIAGGLEDEVSEIE